MSSLSTSHMLTYAVGDYSIFVKDWKQPSDGIHGYLSRFLASGDPTFQHIAIWTLLQLLESDDNDLVDLIKNAEDVVGMVKTIAEKTVDQSEEDGEDSEGEVVALAEKVVQLLSEPSTGPRSGDGESESKRTGLVEG